MPTKCRIIDTKRISMIRGKTGILLVASVAALHVISAAQLKVKNGSTVQAERSGARKVLPPQQTGAAVIGSQTQGPTPFIVQIAATVSPANSLTSVQFTIQPKAGSVTRPISATYSANYLQSRAYLNTTTGNVFIPVFGLYANFANSVTLTFSFNDKTSQQNNEIGRAHV